MQKFSFLYILLYLSSQVFCQSENTIFRNITADDGLPVASVSDVAQDKYGYIWIGSWDGVFRYDGKKFEKIFDDDGRIITTDKLGQVWISDQNNGLIKYDHELDSLIRYPSIDGRRFSEIIFNDRNKAFVESDSGLTVLDTIANKLVPEPGQQPGKVYGSVTNGREIWFFLNHLNDWKLGTRTVDGIYNYEEIPVDKNRPENLGVESSLPFYNFPYGTDGLMIVTSFGWATRKNDTDTWKFEKPENGEAIGNNADVLFDGKNTLWVNQMNRLFQINIESRKTNEFVHYPVIPTSILPMAGTGSGSRLFLDNQGNLWVSRFAHGLSVLNTFYSDFGLLRDNKGQPIRDILSAFEEEDGSYWVGIRRQIEGLIHFDHKDNVMKSYSGTFDSPPGKSISKDLSHPYPWEINQTKDGSIWLGTGSPGSNRGGLNRIDNETDFITRYKYDPNDPSLMPGNWILILQVDGSNRIWMMDRNYQTSIFDVNTESSYKLPGKNLDKFSAPLVDNEGNIWIRDDAQFSIIDHKTLNVIQSFQGINDPDFVYPHQDNNGTVWVVTDQKLAFINKPFTDIDGFIPLSDSGLPDFTVKTINSDDNLDLWLGTDIGLVKVDPETKEFLLFGYERGLQGYYFDESLKGPSGKLYFWGNGGLNMFNPHEIRKNPHPPQIALKDIVLDDESVLDETKNGIFKRSDKRLTVSPDVNVINYEVSIIHFGGSGQNEFQFYLEGFDKEWRKGYADGIVSYTNLSKGTYILKVKGRNSDGVWSSEKELVITTVLPPWWQTNWAYFLYVLLIGLILYGLFKWQKARITRREREKNLIRELDQAKEIEKAYSKLKSTQNQLIHAEKMASLGELTAGIAHEIQNPLNFVNNFSEVSSEMIEEADEELNKEDIGEAKIILAEIKNNLGKINHHGKRADRIVKNMLMHSRNQSGEKVKTDLNEMVQEYLNLAYHGMQAKDSAFKVEYKTLLDKNIPKIQVVPQDIGRVLINLITNAFQAVNEKRETGINKYVPTVVIGTKYVKKDQSNAEIEVSISDNGPGIPPELAEKIFQPFFTTKPTGEGTGLGLSLAYDTIKAHGGDITVESDEMTGSIFKILLPIK